MNTNDKLTLRQLLLATPETQPVVLRVHDTPSGMVWRVHLWPVPNGTTWQNGVEYTGCARPKRVNMVARCGLFDTEPLLESQVHLVGTEPVAIDSIPRTAVIYEVKSNGGSGE